MSKWPGKWRTSYSTTLARTSAGVGASDGAQRQTMRGSAPALALVGIRRFRFPYHKFVDGDILEELTRASSCCGSKFTVLVCPVGAALSFFKSQQNLAVENLALRHQIGILKRTLGKRRVRFKPSDRRLSVMFLRLWSGWQQALASPEA